MRITVFNPISAALSASEVKWAKAACTLGSKAWILQEMRMAPDGVTFRVKLFSLACLD